MQNQSPSVGGWMLHPLCHIGLGYKSIFLNIYSVSLLSMSNIICSYLNIWSIIIIIILVSPISVIPESVSIGLFFSSCGLCFPVSLHIWQFMIEYQTFWTLYCCKLDIFVLLKIFSVFFFWNMVYLKTVSFLWVLLLRLVKQLEI